MTRGHFITGETDPLAVAKRELLEETGYSADEWELLFTNYDYPTKDVNQVNIYLAKNIMSLGDGGGGPFLANEMSL